MDATLRRIEEALGEAARVLVPFIPGAVAFDDKGGGDPVTAADRALNELLRDLLPRADEGWLSEETVDDLSRLGKRRVWVVDPLDGTREFVAGIPQWSVSIGLVEDGQPVAGGVLNPATGEQFLGAVGCALLSAADPRGSASAVPRGRRRAGQPQRGRTRGVGALPGGVLHGEACGIRSLQRCPRCGRAGRRDVDAGP